MEMRKGYKQTEVGVIPEDWDVKKIAQIAPLQRGFDLPSSQLKEGNFPVVYSNGIMNHHEKFMARAPGVVTGRSGTLGKIHYVEEDYWPHNTSLWVTRFNNNFPKFIYYLYTYIGFERFSAGSGVPTLNRNDAHGFQVALPPTLAEQEAIAEALSDADALIESLETLLAKKRQVKQGAMSGLLSGKRRVVESGEWKPVTMIDLLVQSATYGIVKAGEFQPSGIPMLRGGDIKEGRILTDLPFVTQEKSNEFSRTVLKAGDVVIALVGYPGEAAKVPAELEGANISRAVGLLRPNNKVNPDYLVHYLNSTMGRSMVLAPSAGSAQLVVNLSELNKLQFNMPPLPEQTAIAEILSDMDAEIRAVEEKLSKARAVKAGMMSELLTGRVRLV